MKRSLMAKLMVSTGLLVLSIVLIVSTISFKYSSAAIEKEVETNLSEQLNNLIVSLNREQEDVENLLEVIDDMPIINNLKSSTLTSDEEKAVNLYLNAFEDSNPELIDTIFIANDQGIVYADSEYGGLKGLSISDREYFKKAKEGKSSWSEILDAKGSDEWVRVYSYPIKNNKGTVLGYLTAAVKINSIVEEINNIKIGKLGYAYMVDPNGLIVVHPDAEYMMKKNIADLGIPELTDSLDDMIQGKTGEVRYTMNKIAKLNIFSAFDNYSISINAAKSEYMAPVISMQRTIVLAGVVMLLVGLIATFVISRYIVGRINKMKTVMLAAAQGDLTVQVDQVKEDGDEINQISKSLNIMLASFNKIVTDIVKATEVLSSSSQQMASSAEEGGKACSDVAVAIQDISRGVESQASDINVTKGIVVDMKDKLDTSSEETMKISREADIVMITAQNSQKLIYDTIEKMTEIKASSEKTIQVINKLNEQSDKINRISDTISDIADQTNLLALNAAIEAARAGEAGKGFAVVADEIRKLANDSQTSANGINQLIGEIQTEIHEANDFTRAESEAIESGVVAIDNTGKAFEEILKLIDNTTESIRVVVTMIQDSKSLGDSVNHSVENMTEVMVRSSAKTQEVSAATEEQTAVSEEIAAAAEHLSKVALDLFSQVSQYKI